MSIVVNTQYALSSQGLPTAGEIENWAQAAIDASAQADQHINAELTVRIVDEEEGAALNQAYRQRPGATNVLAFPFEPPLQKTPAAGMQNYLGDLAICAPVVEREAREQHKVTIAHWAHMVVHGSLHLLGYDHNDDDQAEAMETLEINILTRIGYANPYLETDDV
jgi:probable rRNA maturation factor